jgi:hypothetical protein
MRSFICLMLLITSSITLAAPNMQLPSGTIACPSVQNLYKIKSTMNWKANGGWLSHQQSFTTKVSHFLGAQWRGANVGNIYCLYQGSNNLTFMIHLQYNKLAFLPSGGKWGKNTHGYQNCISHQQSDCYFKPMIKQSTKNIYDIADHLKSGSPQEVGF